MPGHKFWLLAIMLAALFSFTPAKAGCVDAEGVTFALQRDIPGISVHDTVEGAALEALASIVEMAPDVGSIIAFIHPMAIHPEYGLMLLVLFFDRDGCVSYHMELPAAFFDEKVKLARDRVAS